MIDNQDELSSLEEETDAMRNKSAKFREYAQQLKWQ